MILNQQEHFFDVGQSKLLPPRSLILTEGLKLAGSYAIGLNRVRFRQEVAEVPEKTARDFGREIDVAFSCELVPLSTSKGLRRAGAAYGSSARHLRPVGQLHQRFDLPEAASRVDTAHSIIPYRCIP